MLSVEGNNKQLVRKQYTCIPVGNTTKNKPHNYANQCTTIPPHQQQTAVNKTKNFSPSHYQNKNPPYPFSFPSQTLINHH